MKRTRFGRRGAALVLFAFIYITYGIGLGAAPRPTRVGLQLLIAGIPTDALAVAWVVTGTVAAAAAVPRLGVPQSVGFVALMLMSSVWALSYLWSWIMWLGSIGDGNPLGWSGALIWGLLVGLIGVISGWPEVPKIEGQPA